MVDYVKDIVAAWDKAVPKVNEDSFETVCKLCKKGRMSAAPEDSFKINDDSEKLKPVKAMSFHTIMVKALYLVKRGRPDASVVIAFFTTCIWEPTVDSWRKLEHLVENFCITMNLLLNLGADTTSVLN